MDAIIQLNELLATSERWLNRLRERDASLFSTPEQRQNFLQQYTIWCETCQAILPEDLRKYFDHALSDLPPQPGADDTHAWSYFSQLQYTIKDQHQQLFIARRRQWQPSSQYPTVRRAIASVCRNGYTIYTQDALFVESGWEQHWYIPTTEGDRGAKAENNALGWLDGLLLYAPEREEELLRRVCERILQKPRLRAEYRETIEQALAAFDAPRAPNVLSAMALHPTVRDLAGPLMAIEHYDEALLKVCIALNNAVQDKTHRNDLDGTALMNQAFSSKNPIIRIADNDTEQLGWMQLYVGAIQALRNPRAHHLEHTTTREEAIEWLHFLSALFRKLDKATIYRAFALCHKIKI